MKEEESDWEQEEKVSLFFFLSFLFSSFLSYSSIFLESLALGFLLVHATRLGGGLLLSIHT